MNLADPRTLKELLGRHGIRAVKGLGQHFLCSTSAVESIVARVDGLHGVLEIGPGPGVLTSSLCERVESVVALELDPRMIEVLAESAPGATVIRGDALKADLAEILRSLPEPKAVVSNLPYYITGPLLTAIADARDYYDKAVLMMQREVAQRVTAPADSPARGSLSVFLQSLFLIETVRQVPAGSFMPPPKVDSTVLEFVPNGVVRSKEAEAALFRLIRIGFKQPRKTLANNLSVGYGVDRGVAVGWMASSGLDAKVRPQVLSVEKWEALARHC